MNKQYDKNVYCQFLNHIISNQLVKTWIIIVESMPAQEGNTPNIK